MKKLLTVILSLVMFCTAMVTVVSAEETKHIITADDIHSYLTSTEGFVPAENISYDAEKGARFFNGNGASAYTRIGTVWTTFNFPYDGLRLEFSDITMAGASADLKSRISVEFTPNEVGATGFGSQLKSLIFVPAPGFFGNNDLILNIGGGVQNLPEEFTVGNNLLEPVYVKPGSQPYAHLFEDKASYSIQFNKVDAENIMITVDDCVYYLVPASVFSSALTEGTYADLPVGNTVINIRTWNGSLGYDFYWNSVTTGVAAPVLPTKMTKEELQDAVSLKTASEIKIDYENMMITVPFATTAKQLKDELVLGENFAVAVMNGADAAADADALTSDMTAVLTNSQFEIDNGVFSITVLPEENKEDNKDQNKDENKNDSDQKDDEKEDNKGDSKVPETGEASGLAGFVALMLVGSALIVLGKKKYSVK